MRFVYPGVALVALSIVVLEVAFTRVFAILMWHHLSYLVISLAMLGLGAAGSVIAVRRHDPDRSRLLATLSRSAFLFSATAVVALLIVRRMPLDTLLLWREPGQLVWLGLVCAVMVVPFFFAGLVIGLALSRMGEAIGRLYFFDLVGSAVGAWLSVALLASVGSGATIVLAASAAGVGSALFAIAGPRPALLRAAPGAAIALLLAVGVAWGVPGLGEGPWRLPIPFAPGKEMALAAARSEITRLYSATAEVEVSAPSPIPAIAGGDFGLLDRTQPRGRLVAQDGTAPTALYEGASDLARFPFLDDAQTAASYVALRARNGADPEVLVIGVGGGLDVMIALAHGARRVVAAEINSAMVELVTERAPEYIGGLFTSGAHPLADRIELVNREGRAFARSQPPQSFDMIQLAGVDSFTALSTGAYTLAESYLYTVEAVKDFYGLLRDDGYLTFSRFMMPPPKRPRETLRLANIAVKALAELGVEAPERHVLVLQGAKWAATIVKRGAFEPREVDAVRHFAAREGFSGIVFDPRPEAAPPEPLPRPKRSRPPVPQSTVDAFDTLLRGAPAEQAAFVAGYEYDVTPATDDRPFFFNYYRYDALFRRLIERDTEGPQHRYVPDLPIGHLVLTASLVQVGLLAALLIGIPFAWIARRTGARPRGGGAVLAYFAALGLGFMFIEIALMQKLVLFLGHPTYAVTVVLATLLSAAGLGALFSERLVASSRRTLARVGGAGAVALVLAIVIVGQALPRLLDLPFAARVLVTVATIGPLGFVLGMPFPIGMRIVAARQPALAPWAWSINAYLSVVASTLCIVLAMATGFAAVLWLAGTIYTVGLVAMGMWIGRGGA